MSILVQGPAVPLPRSGYQTDRDWWPGINRERRVCRLCQSRRQGSHSTAEAALDINTVASSVGLT